MRRVISTLLIGLGGFLLVMSLMIKFYTYPTLAVAPIDQDSVTSLSATDAIVFDTTPTVLTEIVTDLSVTSTTRSDVEASEQATEDQGKEVRVWAGTQTVEDADGIVRSQDADLTAFDAHTSEAINCCDAFVEEEEGVREPVERSGIVYKFPFGTEQKTYKWWDGTIGDTVDMKFVEETDIDGLTVYKFEGEIPPTVVGEREIPASVALEPGTGNVVADSVYANKRTFWIEPETGVIINRVEEQRSTLEIDGEERVIMTEADLEYTDEQVQTNVDDWKTKSTLLGLMAGFVPWLTLVLGLLLIVGGLVLGRRKADDTPPGDAAPSARQHAAV